MKCPIDNATLQMTSREGIEIDYCPECRGVWLDRGELDKLIERSSADVPPPGEVRGVREDGRPTSEHAVYYDDDDRHQNRHYDQDHDSEHGRKKKKEGFMSDLFDF